MKEKKQGKNWGIWNKMAPVLTFVIIFIIWEGGIRLFHVSRTILPPITAIVHTLVTTFASELALHAWCTLRAVLLGMAIGVPCGILLASVVSQLKIVERVISPYIIILVTMPMVALLPIILTWIGFGEKARIIVVICQVIPIVTLNSITGFNSIEREKINLGKSVGASRFKIFTKIIFPNAWPYVFTGMRLGSIFATTATISAELVSSSEGLGNRVIYYSKIVATESTFSCIFLIAIIGVSFFTILTAIEKRVVVWKTL